MKKYLLISAILLLILCLSFLFKFLISNKVQYTKSQFNSMNDSTYVYDLYEIKNLEFKKNIKIYASYFEYIENERKIKPCGYIHYSDEKTLMIEMYFDKKGFNFLETDNVFKYSGYSFYFDDDVQILKDWLEHKKENISVIRDKRNGEPVFSDHNYILLSISPKIKIIDYWIDNHEIFDSILIKNNIRTVKIKH